MENTHCWTASWLAKDALESGPRSPLEVKKKVLSWSPVQKNTLGETFTSLGLGSTTQANIRRLVHTVSLPLLLLVLHWVLAPEKLPCQCRFLSNDECLSLLQYSETHERASRRLCPVVEGGAGHQPVCAGILASCVALGSLIAPEHSVSPSTK